MAGEWTGTLFRITLYRAYGRAGRDGDGPEKHLRRSADAERPAGAAGKPSGGLFAGVLGTYGSERRCDSKYAAQPGGRRQFPERIEGVSRSIQLEACNE